MQTRCTFQDEICIEKTLYRSVIPKENRTLKSRLKKLVLDYVMPSHQPTITLPLYHKPLAISSKCRILLVDHHKAHASSAYYTSGLNNERSLVVTMDGVGDATASIQKYLEQKLNKTEKVA